MSNANQTTNRLVTFALVIACSALVHAGCGSARTVEVATLGPQFAPTIWESIEIIPSAAAVQRDFLPLAILRIDATPGYFDDGMAERLRRGAAQVGANAVVLEELQTVEAVDGSAPRVEPVQPGWQGVATAVRIIDGRWGDRYWRYGTALGPLGGEVAADPGWQRVASWSGSGTERTDGFLVTAEEWRIVWEAADATGTLEILVYSQPDQVLTARIDQAGMATGSYLGLAGEGSYYLQINGEGASWTIAVDAWSRP